MTAAQGMAKNDPDRAGFSDVAWADVIRHMDETYSDLIHHQIALEEKNADLESIRAFMDSVLGSMTDVLIVCDPGGQVLEVNAALERETGRARDTLIGTPVETLFESASRPELSRKLDAARRRAKLGHCELTLACAEHSAPLEVSVAMRRDPRGRMIGLVLIGRPVGELRSAYEGLKQAQAQLVHSEKLASLGRLVAGVAHELNNPISFIYGNAHALERYIGRLETYFEKVHEGASRAELIELRESLRLDRAVGNLRSAVTGALEGAERVRDIVEDLRRYSAAAEGARDTYDLVAIARNAVGWVVKGRPDRPRVEWSAPERLVITGHAGHAQQIVMNLVQNALDAMEESDETRMDMTIAETDDGAELRLRDHGSGLLEDVMLRLFDPFFTTKPVGKGTGLGLSISYKLARDQGGGLSAENHPEGGAVFTLRLPREAAT